MRQRIVTYPNRVAYALLWGFFAATLVTPAAPLNKLLFAAIGIWLLKDMLYAPRGGVPLLAAPLIVLAIFAYGFALSWPNRSDPALALQFFTAAFLPFLIHFTRRHSVDVDRLVESSSLVLLAATALYWSALFWPAMPLAEQVVSLVQGVGMGAFAERELLDDPTLSIHLGTVPFLFVAFCLRASRFFGRYALRDLFGLAALAIGIMASGSRGLIAITALFLLFVLIGRVPPLMRVVVTIITAVCIWGAIDAYFGDSLVLSAEETSNAVKIGHARSFFEQFTSASALFGNGLASYYFSSGSNIYTAHTEITPLDMARYVGIPLAGLLYLTVLFPTTRWARYRGANARWVTAFALYALLSATNPVMFNSYGMLVVLWYWSKLFGVQPAAAAPGRTEQPRRKAAAA